jgi:hypothetical protein
VLIPTGGNLVRVLSSKQSIVNGRIDKLERRQAKSLEPPESSKSSKSSKSSSKSATSGTNNDESGAILRDNQDKPEDA